MSELNVEDQSLECQQEEKVVDAKKYKKNKKLKKEALTSDIIKKLVLFHKKTDDGLKELAEMCCKEHDGE
jgi:hypothetical protein